jgi:hypothetical protein
MMNDRRSSEKHTFFAKNAKKPKTYLTHIFMKIKLNLQNFITKMISVKSSTNSESFKRFGCGRRIDLEIFHGYTHWSSPSFSSIVDGVGSCLSSSPTISLQAFSKKNIEKYDHILS